MGHISARRQAGKNVLHKLLFLLRHVAYFHLTSLPPSPPFASTPLLHTTAFRAYIFYDYDCVAECFYCFHFLQRLPLPRRNAPWHRWHCNCFVRASVYFLQPLFAGNAGYAAFFALMLIYGISVDILAMRVNRMSCGKHTHTHIRNYARLEMNVIKMKLQRVFQRVFAQTHTEKRIFWYLLYKFAFFSYF